MIMSFIGSRILHNHHSHKSWIWLPYSQPSNFPHPTFNNSELHHSPRWIAHPPCHESWCWYSKPIQPSLKVPRATNFESETEIPIKDNFEHIMVHIRKYISCIWSENMWYVDVIYPAGNKQPASPRLVFGWLWFPCLGCVCGYSIVFREVVSWCSNMLAIPEIDAELHDTLLTCQLIPGWTSALWAEWITRESWISIVEGMSISQSSKKPSYPKSFVVAKGEGLKSETDCQLLQLSN